MKNNVHIATPRRVCFPLISTCWDAALTQYRIEGIGTVFQIGPHALCDVDGNSLELSDVKDGMLVKIRTKRVWHAYVGYDYLYTADGRYGKCLAIYNIEF